VSSNDSSLAARTHRAVDGAASAAHAATDRLARKADQIGALPGRVRDGTHEYVRANAIAAIGIAFVAGFAIGRLGR
jgi:ElaB/YqjD/DUF883 family membrane-anchored ribosome-binding protein